MVIVVTAEFLVTINVLVNVCKYLMVTFDTKFNSVICLLLLCEAQNYFILSVFCVCLIKLERSWLTVAR
jgi:hypothetical protein